MSKIKWMKKECCQDSGSYEATYEMQVYWSQCRKFTVQRDRHRPEDRYGHVGQWEKFSKWDVWDEEAGCQVKKFGTVKEAKDWVQQYSEVPPLPFEQDNPHKKYEAM